MVKSEPLNCIAVPVTVISQRLEISLYEGLLLMYVSLCRYIPPSLFTASPDPATAARLCCYVAGGTEERHHGLWKAGGICQFGDRYSPGSYHVQTESPTATWSTSKGEFNELQCNSLIFM